MAWSNAMRHEPGIATVSVICAGAVREEKSMVTGPHDARHARGRGRRLGLYYARRRAWRRCGGDHEAFPAIMREEATGYLYPYAHEPVEPAAESIGRALLINVMRVTAACILVAVAIILWDLWPYLRHLAGW
jgi:hypothetical protein